MSCPDPGTGPLPRNAPNCPLCGGPNNCAPVCAGSFDVDCWCRSVTFSAAVLAALPEDARGTACLCRACALGVEISGASGET